MKYHKWTVFEEEFIREHAATLKDEEACEQLSQITGRSINVHSYRKKRYKLGVKKEKGKGVCRVSKEPTVEQWWEVI